MKFIKNKVLSFFLLVLFTWCLTSVSANAAQQNIRDKDWLGSWGRPLIQALQSAELQSFFPPIYTNGLSNQTIREIVQFTASGSTVRLRFYSQPVDAYKSTFITTISEIHIASQDPAQNNQTILPSTDTLVTFNGGNTSVDIPPGGEVLSDPISFNAVAGQNAAVSLYFSAASPSLAPTAMYLAPVNEFLAAQTGNFTGSASFAVDPSSIGINGPLWLKGIDVVVKGNLGTVLCMGDSITAGTNSSFNASNDYPNRLAVRLNGKFQGNFGVINQGIVGNKVLTGSPFGPTSGPIFGASASQRLSRDILNQTNVSYIIWLEGVNDIGLDNATSTQIINGITQAVKQIRATNPSIQIFGGTIMPAQGTPLYAVWGATQENTRQAVNQWIRTTAVDSDIFDHFIDFDAALRDPANNAQLNPAFDSGDHLHPNDAGYQVMANTVNLNFFQGFHKKK